MIFITKPKILPGISSKVRRSKQKRREVFKKEEISSKVFGSMVIFSGFRRSSTSAQDTTGLRKTRESFSDLHPGPAPQRPYIDPMGGENPYISTLPAVPAPLFAWTTGAIDPGRPDQPGKAEHYFSMSARIGTGRVSILRTLPGS